MAKVRQLTTQDQIVLGIVSYIWSLGLINLPDLVSTPSDEMGHEADWTYINESF